MAVGELIVKYEMRDSSGHLRGFTLAELLVVSMIIVLMLSLVAPAVTGMLRGNAQSQALNLIRAQLATARSVAISQHRQAGLVFFADDSNKDLTAMQIIVSDTVGSKMVSGSR